MSSPTPAAPPSVASARALLRPMLALLRRPDLWPIAGRSALDLAPKRWWARSPFLPLPDRSWLQMRLITAYGGDGRAEPAAEDLITWLEWRRTWGHER